jgi:CheY-like chemotaxis protein
VQRAFKCPLTPDSCTMSPITILHVDDDSNDVVLFEHACQKAGVSCNLHNVEDGDEAISYLRGEQQFANRERYPIPTLVLLDLKMPRMNGFDLLAWVRSHEEFGALPIVVLSSSNHESDVKRAYDLGANSYLVKPVGFDSLVEIVRALSQYWLTLNTKTGN